MALPVREWRSDDEASLASFDTFDMLSRSTRIFESYMGSLMAATTDDVRAAVRAATGGTDG